MSVLPPMAAGPVLCRWWLLSSLMLLSSSCVTLPTTASAVERHALLLSDPAVAPELGPGPAAQADHPDLPLLHVRPLRASGSAAERGCVVLQADGRMLEDPLMEWFQQPAAVLSDALVSHLSLAPAFRGVLPAGSRSRPGRILEGDLTAFHVEAGTLTAIVHLRLHLLDDQGSLLMQAMCRGTAPVTDLKTSSLIVGLSRAADMALAQARAQPWF